jgi:poly-gamma-glutamate capsule biosynthesis protein CapA/YwtB (metallophosphatase superfamily)
VKLALAGDTMLGRGVAERLAAASPESLFAPELVAAVEEADLCLLNLECCVSERGTPAAARTFRFRAPPVAVEALANLSVDCVTLANNHALDFGPEDAAGATRPGVAYANLAHGRVPDSTTIMSPSCAFMVKLSLLSATLTLR